jgi:plasmid segregation protein ParM
MSGDYKGEISSGVKVHVDGKPYVACVEPEQLANWERALHDDYPASPEYRALFYAAMLQTGRSVVDQLVTGLPVSHFQDEKRKLKLQKRLSGIHDVAPGLAVRVDKVDVVPQPVGSYLKIAVSGGREDEFADAEVLVVDPGFFSVDWVYLSGTEVRQEWSGSSTLATSRLLEEMSTLIYREYEFRISPEKIERMIRAGKTLLPIPRYQVPIAEPLKVASEKVCPMVMNHLQASMRTKQNDISIVILAGGGAEYYRSAVEAIFPRAEILVPKESVTANARGFWYYGTL